MGEHTVAWECDYPHSDSNWPQSPEMLMAEFEAVGTSDELIHKITWENACAFYNWDPFEHTPREQATVGALRALGDRRRHQRDPQGPVPRAVPGRGLGLTRTAAVPGQSMQAMAMSGQ